MKQPTDDDIDLIQIRTGSSQWNAVDLRDGKHIARVTERLVFGPHYVISWPTDGCRETDTLHETRDAVVDALLKAIEKKP